MPDINIHPVQKTFRVLFLCTGNSARSLMAEALLNMLGHGRLGHGRLGQSRFHAYSAGSHPSGQVQPRAAELTAKLGYDTNLLRSKSWGEFAAGHGPALDMVITVCGNAAAETCPVWPGGPVTAHWAVDDPAACAGDEGARRQAYLTAFALLRRRVELLAALPLEKLDRLATQQHIRAIGRAGP